MPRVARAALLVFAATMGFDLPAPPVPVHAVWADVALALAIGATLLALLLRLVPRPQAAPGAFAAGIAYLGWTGLSAASAPGATGGRIGWVLGVTALVGVLGATVTWTEGAGGAPMRDRLLRAWIGGALLLGLIGLGAGALAQTGHPLRWLHAGAGELGLAFRPAGLQRVGLLAQLALVPFIVVLADGERLLGRRMRTAALTILALVLGAGLTRTLLAVVLGVVLLRVPRRGARRFAIAGLVLAAVAALLLDVHGGDARGIRWRIAAAALATLKAHPLLGVGPTAAIALVGWPGPHDATTSWDAHMTVLDIGARAGIPAVVAFLALVALTLRGLRQHLQDPLRAALTVGLWCTVFDAFCVDVEDFRHVWLLLGLCAGYAASAPGVTGSELSERDDEEPVEG